MTKDFLLVTSWQRGEASDQRELGKRLEDRGFRVQYFSPTPHEGIVDGKEPNTHIPDPKGESKLATPEDLEQNFGIPSLRHLYFTEMNYFKLTPNQAVLRAVRSARALIDLFEEQNFDYVFQGRGGEVHRLLAHYLANHHGASSVWGEFSPFDDRVAFSTRLDGKWDSYSTTPYSQIRTVEKTETKGYINTFLREQERYTYSGDGGGSLSSKKKIRQVAEKVRSAGVKGAVGRATIHTANQVKGAINRWQVPSIAASRRLCQDGKFVFFPLQYPIESRLTVFSPQYFNQRHLVEYIGRILPSSVKLLIKQHPNHPGQQSPTWIARVKQMDGVHFLNANLNAHEAIKHAKCVVVTNNTVGFETIFHQTPLVVLGTAFYEDTPAATTVDDLSTLPAQLAVSVRDEISDETAIASIYSLREAAYNGGGKSREEYLNNYVDPLLKFIHDYGGSS